MLDLGEMKLTKTAFLGVVFLCGVAGAGEMTRQELAPLAFDTLPAGTIRPEGWLKYQLNAMTEGLQGRLYENGRFLQRPNGWTNPDGKWGWEEQPYWLRTFLKLAILTDNKRMLGVAQEWIDGVLSTARPDGWYGPTDLCAHRCKTTGKVVSDIWPHMVMSETLLTWYEYKRDPRVPAVLAGFAR